MRFRLPDQRDTVSWVEMDCRQKEWSKRFIRSNMMMPISILCSFRSSSFAIYVRSNRPVKLRSLPRLDPRTGVRLNSAGCYCQSKCRTRLRVRNYAGIVGSKLISSPVR